MHKETNEMDENVHSVIWIPLHNEGGLWAH